MRALGQLYLRCITSKSLSAGLFIRALRQLANPYLVFICVAVYWPRQLCHLRTSTKGYAMSEPQTSGTVHLERTDAFMPSDETDAIFLSNRLGSAARCMGAALCAALVCAILSLV